MKKILIIMFIILPITLLNFNVLGQMTETTVNSWAPYSWGYRQTTNLESNENITITFDYSDTEYYDLETNLTDFVNMFQSDLIIELSLRSTSGVLNPTPTTQDAFRLRISYDGNINVFLESSSDDVNWSSYNTTYVINNPTYVFPKILLSFDIRENSINFYWGEYQDISNYMGNLSQFDTNDMATSTYNATIIPIVNGNVVAYTDDFNLRVFDGLVEITSYFDVSSEYYKNIGGIQATQNFNGLLSVASLVVGVVINMVLFIANLSVFDISILSIFTLIFSVIGVIWILKVFRGN